MPIDLAAALADELPLLKRDGGFIRAGFDPDLDELRELQQDSRRFIAALQARYATETGCRTLRVKHNHMIGYFVEVPQNVGEDLLKEPWKDTFVHRQTMAGAMRFSTVELGELEVEDRLRGRPGAEDRARPVRRDGAGASSISPATSRLRPRPLPSST